MGALVAIEAALAWPDKVAGLVLCAAAPRLPVSRDLMKVLDDDYAHFPAWLAERAFSASAKPALRRAFVAAGVAAPQAVTRADFEAIDGVDLGARLRADPLPDRLARWRGRRIVGEPSAATSRGVPHAGGRRTPGSHRSAGGRGARAATRFPGVASNH